jgi:hypothetical protein
MDFDAGSDAADAVPPVVIYPAMDFDAGDAGDSGDP